MMTTKMTANNMLMNMTQEMTRKNSQLMLSETQKKKMETPEDREKKEGLLQAQDLGHEEGENKEFTRLMTGNSYVAAIGSYFHFSLQSKVQQSNV